MAACEPGQRAELYSVIVNNLREGLRQWERGLPNYTDAELAQCFDEHFKLGYNGPDVRNKDNLFLRFDHITDEAEWAKRITGYIGEMARRPKSIAASLARREGRTGPISPDVSPDELTGPEIWVAESARPDVLTGEADLREKACKWAEGFFLALNDVQKAALLSIARDCGVTDPEILRLCGRGKSSVAHARKELPNVLRLKLSRVYATEYPEIIDALALEIAKAMLPYAEKWGSSGNPMP